MKLSATGIKTAKPKEKSYKLFDGEGLYLEVMPNGSKLWRMKYRYGGKEKRLAIGKYPDVTLAKARQVKGEARSKLAEGIDPSLAKQMEKAQLDADTFEAVAREWYSKAIGKWSAVYAKETMARMERNLFPWLGMISISKITAPQLLAVLRRIEARGANELAHKCKQVSGQVFRYAIATGRAERDPSQDLAGALASYSVKHFATITEPKEIGKLLRAIDSYSGDSITRYALQLAPLVFVRPGELRHAEWSEIDMDKAEWKIPAEKMKMRDPHIVPLSDYALAVLEEIHPLTGPDGYVFPSVRSRSRPMSENTVNASLRRMGYTKEDMTGHGFRGMASTLLHKQGWPTDVIERQLAHKERNKVKASYNHAEHLPERRRMMQHWADYLDGLKRGGDVVPIKVSKK